MALLLALAAAVIGPLGSALQQREAMTRTESEVTSPGILFSLARRPLWVAGIAAYMVAFAFQGAALGAGELVVVEPVLAAAIVFALPFGVLISRQTVTGRDLAAAALVSAGIAAFVILSDPGAGRDDAPAGEWALAAVAVGGGIAGFLAAGMKHQGRRRAALIGAAAGLAFGFLAALTKGAAEVIEDDGFAVLGDWHLWALLVTGWGCLTLTQMALQAGEIAPAVATSSSLDPALAVLLGLTLFREDLGDDPARAAGAVIALVAALIGIIALSLMGGREPVQAPTSSSASSS